MEADIKRYELVTMRTGIKRCRKYQGVKFGFGLAKNQRRIETELTDMQTKLKFTDKYKEFDEKRIELCKKHGDKDENGKAKQIPDPMNPDNKMFLGIDDNPEFDKEIEKLTKEYQKEVDDFKDRLKQYNELLQEEIKFELHMISIDDIPPEITAEEIAPLINMITDEGIVKTTPPPPPEDEIKKKKKK